MADLLIISLSVAAVILIVLALSPLLIKRYGVGWRYILWLVLALRLIIPFRPEMPSAPVSIPGYEPSMVEYTESNEPEKEKDTAAAVIREPEKLEEYTFSDMVFAVWLTGAEIFFGIHIASYAVFRLRVKRSMRAVEDGIYVCGEIGSPMLTGFFGPLIILPDSDYTEEERVIVIEHEMTHLRRGDMWYKLIMLIAVSVHWFSPVVHIMARYAVKDMEYTCDKRMMRGKDGEQKKKYAEVILKTMEKR